MKIRTVIIEDETGARQALVKMLSMFYAPVEIVGQADGVQSGYNLIRATNPDLVLLDIKMQDGTGFELLKKFEKVDFKTIFITAYDQYALSAIKFSALDYLLKPLDQNDLIAALDKAHQVIEQNVLNLKIKTLLHNIEKENKKLTVRTSESYHIIPVADILRCEASGNYTVFYLMDGSKILASTTLREYEDMLEGHNFFRLHKSHLINLNQISRFDKKDGGVIIMKDKSIVPVSLRKREQLMKVLESL